jgi:hypothetical protein
MKPFADLYPALSPIELPEAEYNFRRYLEIVAAIAREQEGSAKDATGNHRLEEWLPGNDQPDH